MIQKILFLVLCTFTLSLFSHTPPPPSAPPPPTDLPFPPPMAPPPEAPMPDVPMPEAPMKGYEGAFLKMFLTLIGLLVAIFFTIWVLRRLTQGKFGSLNASRSIKILERRPISQKTVLYLVEADGKQVLLAESQLEVKRLLAYDILSDSSDTT